MLSSSRKETEAVKIVASTLEADDDSEIVSTSPSNGGRPPIDAAHVPKKLWRHSSMDVCANLETKNESKVLVLYTGKVCIYLSFLNDS